MGLIASSLIKTHLKKLVRPAKAGTQLDYTFANGRVELRDVEVNCDVFETADLPLDFSWIRIGYVRIDIPDVLDILAARAAVTVLVHDIFGTARPRTDFCFSDASLFRSHMENQMILALYEFLHHGSKPNFGNGAQSDGEDTSESGGTDGGEPTSKSNKKSPKKGKKMNMFASLLTKSIDLIDVRVERVHLRVIHDTQSAHVSSVLRGDICVSTHGHTHTHIFLFHLDKLWQEIHCWGDMKMPTPLTPPSFISPFAILPRLPCCSHS